MNLQGQPIAVAGAGRSGLAAARLAAHHGAQVTVLDSGDPDKLADRRRELPGVNMVFGAEALTWKEEVQLIVVSPGIDLRSPLLSPWSDAGVPLAGEIEFASRLWDRRVVAITGTNGKTTTTELTAHLLNVNGRRAIAGGNYGKPFAEIVLEEEQEGWEVAVLEVSSFQLETIETFRPDISVWMNFAPDHMDRYDTVEDYRAAKLNLFRNQTAQDHAVINALNGPDIELVPHTVTFSAFDENADYHYRDGAVWHHDTPVVSLADTHLTGRHNAENLMAALSVGALNGLAFPPMAAAARHYQPPRHRCERVPFTGGITVLNDSKATNIHALESSLRSLDGRIVLIAGGKDKGLDYAGLAPWLGEKIAHLVTLGEIRESLAQLAEERRCPCTRAETLEAAVDAAFRAAHPGQTILFSPGTSSFDMFTGYEQRGDAFCALVKQQPAHP